MHAQPEVLGGPDIFVGTSLLALGVVRTGAGLMLVRIHMGA